jgi:Flp pilus assembly protein TadG
VLSLAVVGLVASVMLAVVAIDAGAYLAAASRAQTIADSAALAAAMALDDGRSPTSAAARVADAAGLRLDECTCTRLPVQVKVSSPVNGLVVPQLTARRVVALATATVLDT